MDMLADEMQLTHPTDWYRIKWTDITRRTGGRRILLNYNDSLRNILESVYPEYQWHPWLIEQVSVTFWNDKSNQRRYMDWLESELNITSKEQWYEVDGNELIESNKPGFKTLMGEYYNRSLQGALMAIYPGIYQLANRYR